MIISDGGIITKKTSFVFIILQFIFVSYLIINNFFYFKQKGVLNQKDLEITHLKKDNEFLFQNLKTINIAVENIQNYFSILNNYDRFASLNTKKLNKEFVNIDFEDKQYKKIKPILVRIDDNLNNIDNVMDNRISNLELIAQNVGFKQEEIKNLYKVNYTEQINNKNTVNSIDNSMNKDYKTVNNEEYTNNSIVKNENFSKMNENLKYMHYLESFVNDVPLSEPVSNYRYSSFFGYRNHPFDLETKFHRGIDVAAPINSKILSPAGGDVVFAGVKGGYGNYIKINHGNGVTTEYGHLKTILVKEGDPIKRGDAIGVQGSTGRSTGDHLHYEVKFNNKPLDPKKFIDVGNKIF